MVIAFYLRIDLFKCILHYRAMNTFTALADPTRRQIVEMLADGERTAGEIAGHFAVSSCRVRR